MGLIALGLVQVVGPLGFSLDCDPHRCLRLLGLGVPTTTFIGNHITFHIDLPLEDPFTPNGFNPFRWIN